MPGRDADDIVQSIVEVVLRRAATFDPARGTAEAFVITVARSSVRDMLRDARRAKRDPKRVRPLTETLAVSLRAADTGAERRDLARRVRAGLDRLNEDDRAIAIDLVRLGVNRARERSGLDRSQWVQTKDRIWLTVLRALVE